MTVSISEDNRIQVANIMRGAGLTNAPQSLINKIADLFTTGKWTQTYMNEQIRLLGPAEAPIAVLRGRYRFRLLVQAQSSAALHGWLNDWLAKAPKARGSVRVSIDIDPMSFL